MQTHRRKHARVSFSHTAEITFADQSRETFLIKDISLAGMFLHSHKQFLAEDKCVITVTETWKRTSCTFTIAGRIIRSTAQGTAIQFTSMPAHTYMMLQTSLLYRCHDPLALGEEFAGNCPVILSDVSRAGEAAPSMN